MGSRNHDQDVLLVKGCLSGSEAAWRAFVCRFDPLVRSIVRRQWWLDRYEIEDLTQTVFVSLVSDLDKWDRVHSLSGFVETVADRDCIDEYRKYCAVKRVGCTDPIDHHDGGEDCYKKVPTDCQSQEEELARFEEKELLRQARMSLGERCQDLVNLRIFEELSYKEISEILGATENTLTVQLRRCLQELKANLDELVRKGVGQWKKNTDPTR